MAKKITMNKSFKTDRLKVFIDPLGNTLNLWWGNPKDSVSAYEAEKSWDVIALNKKGEAIGLEKIGFFPNELDPLKYLKYSKQFLLKTGWL